MATLPPNATHSKTRKAWRAWLEAHHEQSTGVWLVSYKKATGKARMDYEEAVEEALCFGWVDSKPGKLDDERAMLWFAPRKPRTGWSGPNKARVEKLLAAGLMHPAGVAKVKQAKADGSWTSLDTVEALTIPSDLRAALAGYSAATENFDAFPRSVKRAILEWILIAKKAETRAARIDETARLANDNIRANQWRSPKAAG